MTKKLYPSQIRRTNDEYQALWDKHQQTKNCPHCGSDRFVATRKVDSEGAFWYFKCSTKPCQMTWRSMVKYSQQA